MGIRVPSLRPQRGLWLWLRPMSSLRAHTWSGLVASTPAHDAEDLLGVWHLEMALSCVSTDSNSTLKNGSTSIWGWSQLVWGPLEVRSHNSSVYPLDLGSLALLSIENRCPNHKEPPSPTGDCYPVSHSQQGSGKSDANSDDRGTGCSQLWACVLHTTDAPSKRLHIF